MHIGTPPYLSRLLIPYCTYRVLRSSSSSNLQQVLTITLRSVPVLSTHLLQLFGTLFPTHSIHPVHSTLSGSTSKHTFTKQLSVPSTDMLQCLRFTYVINGSFKWFHFITNLHDKLSHLTPSICQCKNGVMLGRIFKKS